MTETVNQMQNVYDCRQKYIVLGLTGRTGSGCTEAANLLVREFDSLSPPKPVALDTVEDRKYKIVYDFAKHNWKKFEVIHGRDVITSFVLLEPYVNFHNYVIDTLTKDVAPFSVGDLDLIRELFDAMHERRVAIKNLPEANSNEIQTKQTEAYSFYFEELPAFGEKVKDTLNRVSSNGYTRIYQLIGENIRSSGRPYHTTFVAGHGFAIASRINRIIKILTSRARPHNKEVSVVIDAIRNPFEAHFFKERYSSFYLISINTPDTDRRTRLQSLNLNESEIRDIDCKEYPESLPAAKRFVSQDIQRCIEISDIHINNPGTGTKNTTTLKKQLVYYISLIKHPGLVTPSRHERCMQIAYTAKLNSGCISRQVGAVITDNEASIKAVGWNNSASGQVPCSLRSVETLLNHEDERAFSDYEFNNGEFRACLFGIYGHKVAALKSTGCRGLNLSYCFKDIKNCLDQQKNQVHTRALHAEENAFLQIVKYGGGGIQGGSLYSTASPCELCSKKAYQLGIKEIVFIDPYPGIANSHILTGGANDPELVIYHGAIGRAFYHLYQPIFALKDELAILLGIQIPNKLKEIKEENKHLQEIKQRLETENEILRAENEALRQERSPGRQQPEEMTVEISSALQNVAGSGGAEDNNIELAAV